MRIVPNRLLSSTQTSRCNSRSQSPMRSKNNDVAGLPAPDAANALALKVVIMKVRAA